MSDAGGGDPDRDSRPYESLYRHGDPTPPERTDPGWARHSGIHHDPADSPADDRYAWLFRADDPAPAHARPDPDAPVEEDTHTRLRPVTPEPATTGPAVRLAAGASTVTAPPRSTAAHGASTAVPPDRARRRRGVLVLVLVVLVLGLLVALGVWLARGGLDPAGGSVVAPTNSPTVAGRTPVPSATSDSSGSASASASPSASDAWEGAVAPVVPTAVTAGCTAPDATDDGGAKVSYAADQVVDGDATTAWRCNGTGRGQRLTFDLPAGATVAELGLVNGYTKVDPTSKKDRYPEYRRILTVTWSVGDQRIRQTLSSEEEKPQTLRIPATEAEQVVLTIDTSSAPGSSASTRNAVLIAEVAIGAPA